MYATQIFNSMALLAAGSMLYARVMRCGAAVTGTEDEYSGEGDGDSRRV
jgi:putative component of membrane protein insertase Oxa1/YidC/SpoIIIJ protein YidD